MSEFMNSNIWRMFLITHLNQCLLLSNSWISDWISKAFEAFSQSRWAHARQWRRVYKVSPCRGEMKSLQRRTDQFESNSVCTIISFLLPYLSEQVNMSTLQKFARSLIAFCFVLFIAIWWQSLNETLGLNKNANLWNMPHWNNHILMTIRLRVAFWIPVLIHVETHGYISTNFEPIFVIARK